MDAFGARIWHSKSLFLIRTLSPWYTNDLKRLTKTPKLHFLDSGLLAALRRQANQLGLAPRLGVEHT